MCMQNWQRIEYHSGHFEHIQAFVIFAVENNRCAVEVVVGLKSKGLHM